MKDFPVMRTGHRGRPTVGKTRAPDGVEIVFDDAGAGEPTLVFVHGWAGNRRHWDRQLDAFTAAYRVVRIDLASHGESGTERQQWTTKSFAADVVAVIDALALQRVILIGHSLGGSVVVAAGSALGDRLAGVVGVDCWSALGSAPPEDPQSSILLPDMRADYRTGAAEFVKLMCGPTASPELVERITQEVTSIPPHIGVGVLEGVSRGGPAELADGFLSLSVPISAISSETFRPKDTGALAAFGITNVTMPSTGHYLMLERPDDFNAELALAIARAGDSAA
jgi:sigma-B regulation protein RsbQ